jgi:hypothetical protein
VKLAEKFGDKAVDASADAGGKLFTTLKEWLVGAPAPAEAVQDAAKAMARLEAEPGNDDKAAALRVALGEALAEEPAVYEALQALMAEAAAARITQTQTVSGAGAKAAQVAGDRNTTSIA